MNYLKHYLALVERANSRALFVYTEGHHILPRCLGGSDCAENIADLTPEEHYLAHQLLVKIYPNNHGIILAATMMAKRSGNNKAYGWLRRKYSEITKGLPKSKDHSKKIGDANRGRERTPEWKAKISAALRGRKIPPEVIAKRSISSMGHKRLLGTKWSDERKAKHSALLKGIKKPPRTKEHSDNLAKSLLGNKNRIGGKKHLLEEKNAA